MRVCSTCRNPIPEPLLACMACLTRKSDVEVERIQVDALRKVIANGEDLITAVQDGVRHVKVFTVEKTFCRRDLAALNKRGRINLRLDTLTGICPHCRSRIEELIERGKAHA